MSIAIHLGYKAWLALKSHPKFLPPASSSNDDISYENFGNGVATISGDCGDDDETEIVFTSSSADGSSMTVCNSNISNFDDWENKTRASSPASNGNSFTLAASKDQTGSSTQTPSQGQTASSTPADSNGKTGSKTGAILIGSALHWDGIGQAATKAQIAVQESRKRKQKNLEELVSIQQKRIQLDEALIKTLEANSARQKAHQKVEMLNTALMYATDPEEKARLASRLTASVMEQTANLEPSNNDSHRDAAD